MENTKMTVDGLLCEIESMHGNSNHFDYDGHWSDRTEVLFVIEEFVKVQCNDAVEQYKNAFFGLMKASTVWECLADAQEDIEIALSKVGISFDYCEFMSAREKLGEDDNGNWLSIIDYIKRDHELELGSTRK